MVSMLPLAPLPVQPNGYAPQSPSPMSPMSPALGSPSLRIISSQSPTSPSVQQWRSPPQNAAPAAFDWSPKALATSPVVSQQGLAQTSPVPTLPLQRAGQGSVEDLMPQAVKTSPRPATYVAGERPPKRLLLTSSGLSRPFMMKAFMQLIQARKPSGNPNILYIPDASIANGGDPNVCFGKLRAQMQPLGITSMACLELRTTTPLRLAAQLEWADCVYVDMGNTFYLRHWMRVSGFDRLLPPLVQEQGLVYVGASSGSICAGKTIGTAFWKGWDDPGYGKEWDSSLVGYAGLDLLGGKSIFPHYSEQYTGLVEQRKGELGPQGSLVCLDEDHAYLEGVPQPVVAPQPATPFISLPVSSTSFAPPMHKAPEEDMSPTSPLPGRSLSVSAVPFPRLSLAAAGSAPAVALPVSPALLRGGPPQGEASPLRPRTFPGRPRAASPPPLFGRTTTGSLSMASGTLPMVPPGTVPAAIARGHMVAAC
eukprot:TRINITY_DN114773_c0_g1_i1.p1 TRINITY_DN114773_c0_g1~~TRINITY_DN114773_c0_g1_i1.p1  ORF type:complete len:480 (-),score=91.66 TRINITY_DN114773_c0_g1_i1:254-1693(-)